MSKQFYGPLGAMVDGMIRRSVAKRFHTVYWRPPAYAFPRPFIVAANHNGWFDGYVMYLALSELQAPSVLWIQEYDAFPLFGKVGGMPFNPESTVERALTIRRTIRLMKLNKRGLLIFPEGVLHYPGALLDFGGAMELVARRVGNCPVIPVAISYEAAIHERPECFLLFGDPIASGENIRGKAQAALTNLLVENSWRIRSEPGSFKVLARGTPDVNERWDMRRRPR